MKKENKSKENSKLDVVFLLDRSGSMEGSELDTIGGYNQYLKEQKNNSSLITTVLFDDQYELLHFRKDVQGVSKLTKNEYYVRGCTALYDAIGKTIRKLENFVGVNKVLFVITTDGLENASREYDKAKVKELIKSHPEWEFIYLGANIDSYEEGSSIGICESHISNYKKTKKGLRDLFSSVSFLSECVISEEEIDETWKKELDEDKN